MRTYFLILILLITNCFLTKGQIQTLKKLSLSDFENSIKPSMGYDAIISRYGYPSITTGSGLSILIYTLIDSTSVTIGCHNKGTVYAKYRDKNGNIRDLIYIPSTDQSHIKKKVKKQNRTNKIEHWKLAYHDLKIKPKHNTDGIINGLVMVFAKPYSYDKSCQILYPDTRTCPQYNSSTMTVLWLR